MRILTTIFLLAFLICCANRFNPDKKALSILFDKNSDKGLDISIVNNKFPLNLIDIELNNKKDFINTDDRINSVIETTVKNYYETNCVKDSIHSYKDTYIKNVRLTDSLHTVFLVLFKHYPTGNLNSTALFYDNKKNEFIDNQFDFNLWALYNFKGGKLIPSNLKKAFKINTPEIELVDYDGNRTNDFKFIRLWHNGTFNAIHTTILTVKNNKLDTLYHEEKPIGNDKFIRSN